MILVFHTISGRVGVSGNNRKLAPKAISPRSLSSTFFSVSRIDDNS
jgi:hypothetical protein